MVGMPGAKPRARPPSTRRIGYGTLTTCAIARSAAPATRSPSRTTLSSAPKCIYRSQQTKAVLRMSREGARRSIECLRKVRDRFDLDQHVGPEEAGDLDERARRRLGGVHELVAHRPDRRELRYVDDEDGQLDDVGPVGVGRPERAADVRERRPCLFLPAVGQIPIGVDRHLTGCPHEAAGREGDDMAVAVRPRKIVGRGEGGCHVAGRTSISAGSSSGSSTGSSSCCVRASKYMYAVTRATKGMVSAYTTPATIFSSASGASVRRISSAPRSGPAAIATAVPTPTREATFSQRPRTSSPLRRKASTARRPSTSTTCAASDQRTPSQTAMGSPIPVAPSVIQAAASRPDAPRSARAWVSASLYASTGLTAWSSSTRTSAQTVAAWTRARPSSVSVVPISTALNTSAPSPSPSTAISRLWSTVITSTIGMSKRPIPRNKSARPTYIRLADERTCPHDRRRPTRSGATGVHVAFTATKARSPRSTASAIRTGIGFWSSLISPTEPAATASQKKSVAPVPSTPPVGTP